MSYRNMPKYRNHGLNKPIMKIAIDELEQNGYMYIQIMKLLLIYIKT